MFFHSIALGKLQTNCYILADEKTKQAVMVDAPDNAYTLIEFLEEKGYKLEKIILTHGHFDHILALRELKEKTGAEVLIHQNGTEFLKDGIKNLSHYVRMDWTPIDPDILLKDGDIIQVGEIKLKVLYTPGHTSDCICLLADEFVLSGDTLFLGSIGRVDHPTGDMGQEIESVKEKLMTLSDDLKVYPGHGPATTIGKERKENPFLI